MKSEKEDGKATPAVDHYRCHSIVEAIKFRGIDFDTADLDEDLSAVLISHGFIEPLKPEEIAAVREDLWPLALSVETAEIARLLEDEML